MHFGHHNHKHEYKIENHTLESVEFEKDLGIIIDNGFKFHKQTADAVKKANQILCVIKKSYHTRDAKTISTLYKSLVRPHLEYGNIIWGSNYVGDMRSIEKVQRRATKQIENLRDEPYENQLKTLNLHSLLYRRRRGDMIQIYKVINGLVRIPTNSLFRLRKNGKTRGHDKKILKQHAQKTSRAKYFSQRSVNDWNELTNDIVNAPTLMSFKCKLDQHWKDAWYRIN